MCFASFYLYSYNRQKNETCETEICHTATQFNIEAAPKERSEEVEFSCEGSWPIKYFRCCSENW